MNEDGGEREPELFKCRGVGFLKDINVLMKAFALEVRVQAKHCFFCYFVLFFVLFSMALVVLVVVWVLLGVVLVIIEVVSSHHCYYD